MKIFSPLLYTILFISTAQAQSQNDKSLDPYGYVTKYDQKFNGVGPSVYILPLPRTLGEEMIDSYKEIIPFQDSIYAGFQYERLLTTFKPTSNYQIIQKILPDTISDQDYNKLLLQYIEQKNHVIVYALYNYQGENLIHQDRKKEAINALTMALRYAHLANKTEDIAIIQTNLASTYLFNNENVEALNFEGLYLQHVQNTKDIASQAASQTRIALIQAYMKNYSTAENTIIRKAIPLYNKSKDYDGKINAWTILAEIYRAQNKHTEAQWFLIQARDLAKQHKLDDRLPMIEYMLGSSKLVQTNYKVAKQELEVAWKLAQESSNKYLQLAIAEQLGRTNVHLQNYENAKSYLNHYWNLRNTLFR